jgi:hypothetical protein
VGFVVLLLRHAHVSRLRAFGVYLL